MNAGERERILLRQQRRGGELNDDDGHGEMAGKTNGEHHGVGGEVAVLLKTRTGSSVAYPFSPDLAMHATR